MIDRRLRRGAILGCLALGMLAGCETLKIGSSDKPTDVPAEGLLGAKATALQHAMDNLAEEDKRFLDEEYSAYGLLDRDPFHQRALVAILKVRQPPVVPASELYGRTSNAQWYKGKPALKWTASAAKDPDVANRAEVVVGWMHSQIINQFTTYVMAFNGQSWEVAEVKLLKEAEQLLKADVAAP